MRWILRQPDPAKVRQLANELSLHPIAARILVSRGLDNPAEAERFLSSSLGDLPDPFTMKGMDRAVERLIRALRQQEKVVVYGDYDVDGVSSSAMLVSFLRELGGKADYYIPHRLDEGYGLNPQAVDALVADGAQLIVTVDCGVTAVEEVERATRAGVDVLVVDHHQTPPTLPKAYSMLNPHQPGCAFEFKDLCAAGVTFFLLIALRKQLRDEGFFSERPEPRLVDWLDLAALGTVADVVPLVGANRILVMHGLRQLELGRRIGIEALKQVARLRPGPVNAGQIAFQLGPRINAAGRLDNAGTAVELLLCDDPLVADDLAAHLDDANSQRRAIEREITLQAMEQAQAAPKSERGLVLVGDDWHPGVVGIVASRMVERFHKPAIVLGVSEGKVRGSCRSIEAFNMFEGLERCAEHLEKFGGHRHAAGLSLAPEKIADFRKAFLKETRRQLQPKDLIPVIRVDAEIPTGEASLELAQQLLRLQPFGAGNPEPVFSSETTDPEAWVLPSKTGDRDHLKFRLGNTDCIGFGLGDSRPLMRGRVRVAFNLSVNEWNNRVSPQARVKVVEPF